MVFAQMMPYGVTYFSLFKLINDLLLFIYIIYYGMFLVLH